MNNLSKFMSAVVFTALVVLIITFAVSMFQNSKVSTQLVIGGGSGTSDTGNVNAGGVTQPPSVNVLPVVYDRSTTAFNSQVWPSVLSVTPQKLTFPELCSANLYGNQIPDINKVSIAISGGGSRSFMSTMGYFRALNRMGYKNKAQYVSTVSGGSWFYGVYSFCQTNPRFTDSVILGDSSGLDSSGIPDPRLITLSNLTTDNKNNSLYFGHIFENRDIVDYIVSSFSLPNVPIDTAWNYAIGKMILDPYGLNGDVPVALNSRHARDMTIRNIFNGDPLALPDNMPFWLCNTTLMFNYVNQYPYVHVPMTPLYSGIPQIISQNNNRIGGLLVENYAFGNSNMPVGTLLSLSNVDCPVSQVVNLKKMSSVRTLRDMIGSSSTAFASVLYSPEVISPILKSLLPESSVNLIPLYNIWGTAPLSKTISDSQCSSDLINGGCSVPNGYDKNSCTRIGVQCYSNSATQCSSNSQCSLGLKGCYNKNSKNSDLNCRLNSSVFTPCKCVSSTPYVQSTLQSLNSQQARLSDGVFADNTGILSLLARGSKRIIAIANTSLPVDATYKSYLTLCDIPGLFGLAENPCAAAGLLALNTIQVFNSSDYQNIIVPQYQENLKSGGPVFARANLQVLPNIINGIQGGYTVDILIILLQPSERFASQLPAEVKNQITTSTMTTRKGLFDYFPNYATAFQNTDLGIVSLFLEQSNLLSTYTDWCMSQPELKKHIQEMYSY
jgi:hypothetical protein